MALTLATGCLSTEEIPVTADGSSVTPPIEAAWPDGTVFNDDFRCVPPPDRDPLIGAWVSDDGKECEFFSNGRYSTRCQIGPYGDPFEWARLDDGRYYISATNSFGSITDECTAHAYFSQDCEVLGIEFDCEGQRSTHVLRRR